MRVKRWTLARRLVQCTVVLLLASPAFGTSFFNGNLAAASLFGLQLSDPLASLQILLLTGSVTSSLLIGTGIVLLVYWLLGGRVFCGWICPVHLLTDLTDKLPWTKGLPRWSSGWKLAVLGMVLLLSLLLGLPVFETVSPIGIAGRSLTFGASSSLMILALIVAAELLLVRRLWCRSLCPLGAVYALLGRISPLLVGYLPEQCTHCGACKQVCIVPEVLTPSLSTGTKNIKSGDCTRCGACIDSCSDKALKFALRKSN